jgi:hypothetical protein
MTSTDRENIREHADSKRAVGASREKVAANVRDYATRLGYDAREIEQILQEFGLSP